MKGKAIIPLAIGLAVGLLAVKLGVDVIQRAKASGSNMDTIEVVVAARDIPDTARVQPDMAKCVKTPKSLVPALSFEKPEDVVGRVTNRTIPQGLPILGSMLAPPGTPEGIEVRLRPGYRAMAIKVDEYTMVGGHLRPGCRVDVCAVWNVRVENRTETVSRVILQNVEVLAVGASLSEAGEASTSPARSVTLLVKHEEATKLTFADTKAKIRLALRSPDDAVARAPSGTTESELLSGRPSKAEKNKQGGGLLSKLFGPAKPDRTSPSATPQSGVAVAAAPTPQPYVVELIRGKQKENVYFESEWSVRALPSQGAKLQPRSTRDVSRVSNGFVITRMPARVAPAPRPTGERTPGTGSGKDAAAPEPLRMEDTE